MVRAYTMRLGGVEFSTITVVLEGKYWFWGDSDFEGGLVDGFSGTYVWELGGYAVLYGELAAWFGSDGG